MWILAQLLWVILLLSLMWFVYLFVHICFKTYDSDVYLMWRVDMNINDKDDFWVNNVFYLDAVMTLRQMQYWI